MTVTVGVAQAAARTTTGTQDITTTELGGQTPVAAILIVTKATANGSSVDDAVVSIGAVSGASNRWFVSGTSLDAQTDVDATKDGATSALLRILDAGATTIDGEADFDSFISEGIRIDWPSNAPAAAYLITAILFAGPAVQAHANSITISTSPIDVTAPGFEPDIVFFASVFHSGSSTDDNMLSIGWAVNDGADSQSCLTVLDSSGSVNGNPAAKLTSNRAAVDLFGDASVARDVSIGTFDSSGFTATISSTIADLLFYIAIDLDGSGFDLSRQSTPTSTGNDAVTGIGHIPQAVIQFVSNLTADDTGDATAEAGTWGISAFTASSEYCNTNQVEDGVATTDTKSYVNSTAIDVPQDDGSAGLTAAWVSMDNDGHTLNFSNVLGSARRYINLSIEGRPLDLGRKMPRGVLRGESRGTL